MEGQDGTGWDGMVQDRTGQDRWDCQPYLGQLLSITSACKMGQCHAGSDGLGAGNIYRGMVSAEYRHKRRVSYRASGLSHLVSVYCLNQFFP